jgi:hypothetical protein
MGWFSIIPLALGFFEKLINPIANVTTKIIDQKIQASNAETEQQRIVANEHIKELEMRRDVMVAEAGTRHNRIMRILFAIGPCFIINKLLIWDKALGLGSTDALTSDLWYVIYACIGFYFLMSLSDITKTIRK